ncbi:MAG: ferrous iron transport protein A [Bacteroidia bacterium]|nr:ferrous iron transport protein A [Bacteroidia bacterium]
MNLSELKIGQHAIVDSITDKDLSLKLLELGCILGNSIKLESIAPLGDPLVIKINDSNFGVRKDEAKCILIREK